MAKSNTPEESQPLSYRGEQVDPELEKKVEDYMEESPQDSKVKPDTKSDNSDDSPDGETDTPLLPSDKLPISISVVDHKDDVEDTPEEIVETEAVGSAPELPTEDAEVAEEETPDAEEATNEVEEVEPEVVDDVAETDSEPEDVDAETLEDSEPEIEPTEQTTDLEPIEAEPEIVAKELDLPEPEVNENDDELGLETVQTAHAVEAIIANEADEILAAEDEKKAVAPLVKTSKKNQKKNKGLGAFFRAWATKSKYRWATAFVVLAGVGAVVAVPSNRYYLLNYAGVRASTSLRVIDAKTSQPLKNVELSVDGQSAKTDAEGYVTVGNIRLGEQQMTVKKPAFAEQVRTVTFGWGSNPLDEVKLTPTGTQYQFVVKNFLSDLPILDSVVTFGEASARVNEKGEAVLTIPRIEEEKIIVEVQAESYKTKKVELVTSSQELITVSMVPARTHAFVSKRGGTFDLYKTDIDGGSETKILAGTGLEREDALAVASHGTKNIVAFLSTRENKRNKEGLLLSTLLIVDLDTNESTKVTQSERIQIIDWIGDRLVYVKATEGASQESTDRHKIMSYDIRGGGERELASTNYFNDVLSVNGAIYYSPAQYNVNGSVGLYKINPDATDRKTIYQKEVWNLFRTSYDTVSVSVGQDWFDLELATDALSKAPGPPSVLKSRVYVASPGNKQSLWIDERDGKGVLISYNHATRKETVVRSGAGIKTPMRWLDEEHILYRVANGDETADYVMSLKGGEPKKITDVTNTIGVDRWYYY